MSVTYLETGKVLDFQCLSKYCSICKNSASTKPNACQKNYNGLSGGMESAGILEMYKHSISTRSVRYINYLGDGDSKAYGTVRKSYVYGPDIIIEKNWNA